jgi:TM2 domain-containing membrane protein YozV
MSGNMSGLSFNGAIVRAGSGVDKFYMGFAFSGGLYIYSRDTGVYTQLTTVATQANNGDILKLEAIGSAHPVTVNLYRNGTLAATWTSTSSANAYTGGYPGICLFLNAADLGKGLDNWEGASLTLSAAQGSFALTGEPVNLSRTIAVDSGLFALSGQNVTLTVGALSISPLTGFFVFTGYSANFITPLTSGALYVYSTSTARIDVSQQISDRIDVIP